MAEAMEGIMGLPNAPMDDQSNEGLMSLGNAGMDVSSMIDMQALEQASAEANRDPMTFREGVLSGMEEADPQLVAEFKRALTGMQLPDDVIQALGQMVDEILRSPQDYQEMRQELVTDDVEGIFAELLPETFDMAYFMALDMALDQIAMTTVQAPQAFADGGLATLKPIAAAMAQMGRNGDTILAHITPAEARMLRARGGSGTINPYTGLPEFFFKSVFRAVKKVVKGAAKVVKKVVKTVKNVVSAIAENPIGRIALTIGATMLMGPGGLGLAGGVGGGILGVTTPALALGINTAAASTLVNVASGQSFGDALKGGLLSGVMAGGTAYMFPNMVPDAYKIGPDAAAAANAAASNVQVDDFTVKSAGAGGTDAAATGTGLTGGPTTVADVNVGTPQVLTPSDVSVSATAPTPPTPSFSPEPVWDPNLGESLYQGIPVSQYTPGSPTAVAPMGAYNMPASYANPALAQTPAPSLGGGYSVADQYGTAMSRAPVTGAGAAPSMAPGAAGPSYGDLWQQNDYMGLAKKAGSDVFDFLDPRVDQAAIDARADALVSKGMTYKDALAQATKEAPGVMARYAPLAGAGLGAAYLGGAFEPIPEEPPLDVAGMYDYELQPLQYGGLETTYQRNPYTGEGGTQFRGTGYQGQYQFQPYTPYDYTNRGIGGLTLGQMPDLGVASMPSFQRYAEGGSAEYPRKNGHISGPGGPKDDKIPAMLSDGEFVFTAQAVRNMGNGSRRAGAKKMYALMKALEGRSA